MKTAAVSLGAIALAAITAAYVNTIRSNERSVAQLRSDLIKLQTKLETAAATQQSKVANAVLLSGLAADAATSAAMRAHAADSANLPLEAPLPHLTPDERARADDEQHRKLAGQFDEVLSIDGYDREWSTTMVATLQSVFPSIAAGKLAKAECASSLCRLTVEHSSREEQRSLAQQMATVDALRSETFFRYDKESTPLRTTVYLAREGTALSSLVPQR